MHPRGLLAGLVVSAPAAQAQTATTSAVIKACAGKKGALRIAKRCRSGEKRLRLLATPPAKGDPGPPGPAGSPDTPAQVLGKLQRCWSS